MSKKFKEKDYQGALDVLADRELDDVGKMACRDLQELINNYSKIKQFDRALFFNAKDVVVNGISYEQLEKAFDKACKELGRTMYSKDCWKAWCLNDELL